MMELTIHIPEALAPQMARYQDRMPEVIEAGIKAINVDSTVFQKETDQILMILTQDPAPETSLAIHPSESLQNRIQTLLSAAKENNLNAEERTELERYSMLEHLVRLAKAHAFKKVRSS